MYINIFSSYDSKISEVALRIICHHSNRTATRQPVHRIEKKTTRIGTFEVCAAAHGKLRMFIMLVLAGQ